MIRYEDLSAVNSSLFQAFRKSFDDVLDSGWFILGKHVKEFEQRFAEYHHMPYCIGVGNGLDALVLSLKSLNIPPGNEVIVPSNTYIATIIAIIHGGLKPVLVEPDIATYNIEPSKIEEAISSSTKAILIVHLHSI